MAKNGFFYGIVIAGIFAAGIFLRLNFLNIPDYRGGTDEGYYLRYAACLAQAQDASIKKLSDAYIRNKEWQLFPNPLRAGYILISAWWMKLLGRFDFKALSYLSSLFGILSLFACYFFTRRLFGPRIALLGLILLAASPINLALSRRALQDSAVYFFTIMAVWLFYESLERRGLLFKILFALSFFAAIAVKESSVLVLVFFVVFIFLDKRLFDGQLKSLQSLFILFLVLAAVFFMYIKITGSADKLFQIARIIILSPASNEYAIKYQSGNFFTYMGSFLLLSPITLVLGLSFSALYFKNRDFSEKPYLYIITFFALYYAAFSLFSKNVRYVMALDLPIRILAAALIAAACGKFGKMGWTAALLIAFAIAAGDFFIFHHIFITDGIYDPVICNLAWAWSN
ncbi:MAG: glycosyltransferase family 39 protein [Candidatus Omnitrophota bacterium]